MRRLRLLILIGLLLVVGALPALGQEATPEPIEWQEYTSADGIVTLSFPADWFLGTFEDSSIVITNDPTLIAPEAPPVLDPGDIAITLYLFPRGLTSNFGIAGDTLEEQLASIAALFSPPAPDPEATPEPEATPDADPQPVFGEPEIITVDGIDYGWLPFSAAGFTDGAFIVWDAGEDGTGVALFGTAEGELNAFDDVLYPILSSFRATVSFAELLAAAAEATAVPEATAAP